MTEPTKQPERDDRMSSEDYENLLDRYQYSTKEITMGKILKGRVIKTTPTHVLVDVGFKTEGLIPNEEFTDPDGPGGPEARRRGRDDAREDRPQGRLPRPVQEARRRPPGHREPGPGLRARPDGHGHGHREDPGRVQRRRRHPGLPARVPRRPPSRPGRRPPSSGRPSSSGSSSSTARPRTPSCRASSSSRTSARRRRSASSAAWPRARRSRDGSSP